MDEKVVRLVNKVNSVIMSMATRITITTMTITGLVRGTDLV